MLPNRLDDTFDHIEMISNPRGYGKSALVREMAYKRDEICTRLKVPSGPVLFTDFLGVKSPSDAENKIMETLRPLFLPSFSPLSEERGSCAFIVILAYI